MNLFRTLKFYNLIFRLKIRIRIENIDTCLNYKNSYLQKATKAVNFFLPKFSIGDQFFSIFSQTVTFLGVLLPR